MNPLQCTIEIFTDQQWQDCCTIAIDDPNSGGAGAAMLDYDLNFVFGMTTTSKRGITPLLHKGNN